ncbi:MAG: PilZ domain-containing protein [Oligoflexales bacterium]|nr:PilZ domain-containing protein [Oligoflexales bacterium]
MAETELEEEKKAAQVVEYLQGPRKKRKNYVVMAMSPNFDPDLSSNVSAYVRKNFPNLAVATPKSGEELNRLFSRQILLVLVDDTFTDLNELLHSIKYLKEKKREQSVPILFFTENVTALVKAYHEILLPYQELDNYISYRSMPLSQIYSRIQSTLNQKGARRSRRYEFDLGVKYYHLRRDGYYDGKIIEMSAHGGIIHSVKDEIFNDGDQIKIHIPIFGFMPLEYGEFMRISARVRRVLMGGSKANVSWEYLSQEQYVSLTAFILQYVNNHILRQQNRRR